MSDIGIEAINFVRQQLRIDPKWLVPEKRGFTWWAGELAQRVWAEPCFQDEGVTVARVHARTDVISGFTDSPQHLAALGYFMRQATLSGFICVDPAHAAGAGNGPLLSGTLQLAATVYVHGQSRDWLFRLLALAVALQAAESHIMNGGLAQAFGVFPAVSSHPQTGLRLSTAPNNDPALLARLRTMDREGSIKLKEQQIDPVHSLIEQQIKPSGQGPSAFQGREMHQALKMLAQSPFQASGDAEELTAEFPFGDQTSLVRLVTGATNPRLGNGLLMLHTLPVGSHETVDPEGVRMALLMNARETQEQTQTHFLGSWCHSDQGLTFNAFFPNIVAGFGRGSAATLVQGALFRARWAAQVFGQSFDPERARAGQDALWSRLINLSDEELRRVAANLPGNLSPDQLVGMVHAMREAKQGTSASTGARPASIQSRHPHSSSPSNAEPKARSIRFPCPKCGNQLKAPVDRKGSKSRCPKCRTPVTIP